MREYPLSDAVFYWLSANPKVVPIIFGVVVLFVGYFDTVPGVAQ